LKKNELAELSKFARQDGAQVFRLLSVFETLNLITIALFSLAGVLVVIAAFSTYGLIGLAVSSMATIAILVLIYASLTLGTAVIKLIVHILFCNLMMVESMEQQHESLRPEN
jgi:hypothetical protein